jgi:hypothetical protein
MQGFFPALSNLEDEIPFKGRRSVTPTFYIIKLCQAGSALGCILENLA